MSSRRTLILIGAIALGAFAAFALLNYVRGIEDDVYADAQPVEVLIAAEDIPAGTPASQAQVLFKRTEIPLEIRPATFIDPDFTDSLSGLISLNDIPANQIIVSGLFVDATVVQQSFKDRIPTGQVAISLNVANVKAVGGRLQPGDEVNMMVQHSVGCGVETVDETASEDDTPSSGSDKIFGIPGDGEEAAPEIGDYCTYATPTRYLYQRVEIIAVGTRQTLQPGEATTTAETAVTTTGGVLTFMVPNAAAQVLASVSPSDIYLTLLPEDYEAEVLPALPVEFFDAPTPAEIPEQLTPYGPDGFVIVGTDDVVSSPSESSTEG